MANFENASHNTLVRIRDMVLRDGNAFEKWPRVIDALIVDVADAGQYKRMVRTHEDLGEAVLRTLERWLGFGKVRKDLLDAMRSNGLGEAVRLIEKEIVNKQSLRQDVVDGSSVVQRSKVDMHMDRAGLPVQLTGFGAPATGDHSTRYKMNSNPRGFALVINNWEFTDPSANRKGTEHDYATMKRLFRNLNYHVCAYENVKSTDLDKILTEFKSAFDDLHVDSCVVCVMSHGNQDTVTMADCVDINYWSHLIYQFDGTRFGPFRDRPKIFIIQACRPFSACSAPPPGAPALNSDLSDTLVCLSTLPGTFDWQHGKKGSLYIYCLAQVLMQEAYCTEAQELFGRKVQDGMRGVRIGGQPYPDMQIPSCTAYRFKKFYFNPKELKDD